MSPAGSIGLPEALERAATALPADAGAIRPANGDPFRLRGLLDVEAAARVLQWLLENEPSAGAQLADDWSDDPELDPAPLLQIDASRLSKLARKALRRAHHRLRSRGVEIAEAAGEKVVATLAKVEETLSAAIVTEIDPRGARMVYLVDPNPAGGSRIFEVMIDEERGVGGFEVYSASQGKVKRFLQSLTRRSERPAVEVARESARALIARAASRQSATRSAPRGFSEWRGRIAAGAEGAATPGSLAREALGEIDAGAVARAAELVREREIGPWPPEGPALQATAEKLVEIEKSELEVTGEARSEQIDGILAAGLPEVYGERCASRSAERFEETAYVFWKWGRDDDARACLAAADAFARGAAADNPVARALIEVLLSPVLNRLASGSNDAASAPEGG
jgi:hypothetical protein